VLTSSSDVEPKVSIPKPIKVTDAKFPLHLKAFHDALPSLGPTLRKLAIAVQGYDIFSTRTLQRANNLFLGGGVLQLAVQSLPVDAWRIRWVVGASMKANKYTGFADFSQMGVLLQSVCECHAGEGKCSHLGATIYLLSHVHREGEKVSLCVRKAPLQKPDQYLRLLPLQSVVQRIEKLKSTIFVSS
jgi:hypothetical protein